MDVTQPPRNKLRADLCGAKVRAIFALAHKIFLLNGRSGAPAGGRCMGLSTPAIFLGLTAFINCFRRGLSNKAWWRVGAALMHRIFGT